MASEVKEESNSTPDIKNDEDVAEETSKNVDNSIKEDSKDSVKNESKEESGKEGSEDENEDDDDEEVALLDRPVEVTGCRARKKVERLEMSFSMPKEKQEFQEGKGSKLGECPRIEAQMQKMKVVDLKPLHKILFNRIGSVNEIKKNIRKFSGFPFEENSTEYIRRKASVEKMTTPILKSVCLVLDIERSGTKEDIVNRILSFLMKPEDSGKKVPSKKKASKDKKKSMGKQEKKKGKSEKKTKAEKTDSDDELDENNDEDDDSTGGEASMGGTDEDVEDEAEPSDDEPKKKSKETKGSKAKSKADKGKKEEKKTKGTKRKIDEDSSDNSEDEKPAKKSKMPSDDEISKLVKQILESADLQEITMKKVIKQVSDAYPDFDLSHKKAFIKSTIKSVIS